MFNVAYSLILVALAFKAEHAFGTTCSEPMKEVSREVQEGIETLKEKLLELNSTVQDLIWCYEAEGFNYKRKCYNVILYTSRNVSYAKATELCTAMGGKPADILNAQHQSLVADYVKKKTSLLMEIWLGMNYRISTGGLRFSNGNDVPGEVAASIRWWKAFPKSTPSHGAVAIAVGKTAYGIYNIYPGYATNGVLCEK